MMCPTCRGTGKWPHNYTICPVCAGDGELPDDRINNKTCPVCGGRGTWPMFYQVCKKCGGWGKLPAKTTGTASKGRRIDIDELEAIRDVVEKIPEEKRSVEPAETEEKTQPGKSKGQSKQVEYDTNSCTFSVSRAEVERLETKYPDKNILDEIAEAESRTKYFSEQLKDKVKRNPRGFLEWHLSTEWEPTPSDNRFFPRPAPEPRTLQELADRIHYCRTFADFALTGEYYQAWAKEDFAIFYRKYIELRGEPYRWTDNWPAELTKLEELCRGKEPAETERKPVKEPPKEAAQAYKLYYGSGLSQTKVAEIMTKKLRRPISQGQVSKWVRQYQEWAKANNIPIPEKPSIITVDSDKLDMGPRTDGRVTGDPRHKKDTDYEE